ncbi:cytochrome C biogenesis protein [Nostoc sp. CENA543]|uniref:divalent-cation tolerance protein CutA n=1 Tax=Nostoc sp. CENA543 TaxID=1869241 RepID=UPI000CA0A629|nr:divalent-cation tolerance protein CutA [Nostoc sp. CENA543]AUS99864.1 cytochrome C biogenesis protein [Nostoc sp. CENA543]
MNYIAVVTTVSNLIEAQRMARTLVEQKLAACAQISEIESFYVWDNAVQNEKEFRVLFKTTDENYPAIEEAIKQLHSYELPAIHAFKLEHIYTPYAEWIESNSCGKGEW